MYHNRRTIVKKPAQQSAYEQAFENGKLKKGFRHVKGGGKIKDNHGNIITKE